ncbi:MAG: hypothetical protein ACRCYU_08745 [Nocardioides sp.]
MFATHLAEVIGELARLAHSPVRTIVDLGAGTGTGTFALARRFPRARTLAIDGRLGAADRQLLDRLLDGGRGDVRRRADLHVTTERHLWIARRPVLGGPSES